MLQRVPDMRQEGTSWIASNGYGQAVELSDLADFCCQLVLTAESCVLSVLNAPLGSVDGSNCT